MSIEIAKIILILLKYINFAWLYIKIFISTQKPAKRRKQLRIIITKLKIYEVGKLLIEAQGGEDRAKYGDALIKEYSERLKYDINIKYNFTTLKRMRQFYLMIEKGATLWHQLSWSYHL